jgi:SAM-dependent methyltransferase
MDGKEIKKHVRDRYAGVAREGTSCCGPAASSCGCGCEEGADISRVIGYSGEEIAMVPEGSNLGLGCGNPTALASLKEGETVLDLGSGAGFDCFLAAEKVGPGVRVIGVDMTAEMIERARGNAEKGSYGNVEFRLGEIEQIPVSDGSVDIILSNCVINLSPDKPAVFREAFRVLRPGGRMMVSDIVLLEELPDYITASADSWSACVAGASLKEVYLREIEEAGFSDLKVLGESAMPIDLVLNDPTTKAMMERFNIPPEEAVKVAGSVVSVQVGARKPA